ncbi:hypothetical protein SOVF_200240, partial [Spinacia oleracea]
MRTDNKGNIQEGAKEVAKRIDYFMHQAEKGEIEDTGRLDDMKRRKPKGRKNHSVEEEEDEEEEEKDDEEEKDEEEEEDDEMDVEEENLDGLMLDHIQDTPISSSPE